MRDMAITIVIKIDIIATISTTSIDTSVATIITIIITITIIKHDRNQQSQHQQHSCYTAGAMLSFENCTGTSCADMPLAFVLTDTTFLIKSRLQAQPIRALEKSRQADNQPV